MNHLYLLSLVFKLTASALKINDALLQKSEIPFITFHHSINHLTRVIGSH